MQDNAMPAHAAADAQRLERAGADEGKLRRTLAANPADHGARFALY